MDLYFDKSLAQNYKNHSQAARVLTEAWTKANMYCPRCGNTKLIHFENNRKVADFYCDECKNEYELKSQKRVIGHKIVDGAYDTFIQRITSYNNPDFFVMSYDLDNFCVDNLWIIPKHFFTPSIVEKRKPLSQNAKRKGWVGCNILFDEVPKQGKISIVQNRTVIQKDVVISNVNRSSQLAITALDARGWLLDVLNCINQIPSENFSLEDVYRFDTELKERHPHNSNIHPKMRQQLQILRNKGYLEFLGRGLYRKKV